MIEDDTRIALMNNCIKSWIQEAVTMIAATLFDFNGKFFFAVFMTSSLIASNASESMSIFDGLLFAEERLGAIVRPYSVSMNVDACPSASFFFKGTNCHAGFAGIHI
jgi:hypothetical protein